MPQDPYAIVTRDGKKVDAITDAALRVAEKRLGYTLSITQGSYNAGKVAASAGTHDGGGVVDLMPWDWQNKVIVLRSVGFAAWYRPAIAGLWPAHIHAVLIGHAKLAPSAANQVNAYLSKRDGLKNNGPDVDPGWVGTARFDWQRFVEDQKLRGDLYDAQRQAAKTGRKGLRDRINRWRNKIGVKSR